MATLHASNATASHRRLGADLAILTVVAAALRLPALLADRHLTFDDGVFGASAVAMRHGGVPFRDVFSSQGPLFLPLVWASDLLGLRTLDGPRLVGLLSGVLLTVAVYLLGREVSDRRGAVVAAALVAVTGSVLWVTAPVAADGPSLALATSAVAAAFVLRRRPSMGAAVATGALIGAALAVKSIVLPAAVPVGLVLLGRRRLLAPAVGAAVAVGLLATLPWGFADVWDQSVDYHLDAAGRRTVGANAAKVLSTLGDRDLPLVVAGGAALAWAGWQRRRGPGPDPASDGADDLPTAGDAPRWATDPDVLLGAWLAAMVTLLLLEHPLWRSHIAHLAPPIALLVARRLPPLRLLAVAAVAVLPWHLVHNADVMWPSGYDGAEARAFRDLASLPDDAVAISDEPGLVWRAGLRTPHDLVDTSFLRIDSGRLTAQGVAAEAAEPEVCAVLVWSPRHFGRFGTLPELLSEAGYEVSARYGDERVLYVDPACPAGSAAG